MTQHGGQGRFSVVLHRLFGYKIIEERTTTNRDFSQRIVGYETLSVEECLIILRHI